MIIFAFHRFAASRRSAVAIIFAVSILPLMLLVGIAIDFTFLNQARTKASFAAQAAAVHAIRIADSTYALEVQHGTSAADAATHAIDAANNAGDLWFSNEIGNLSFATISPAPYTNTTSNNDNASPPNFTAQITYTFSYPPIFNPLFGSPTKTWIYSNGATATSQFAYAQILMMLDTSNSMLIGASAQDIKTMELGSVCPVQGYILGADSGNYTTGLLALNFGLFDPTPDSSDNDFVDLTQVSTYNAANSTDINSLCKSVSTTKNGVTTTTKYGIGGANLSAFGSKYLGGSAASTTQSPFSPPNACALACHNTTKKVDVNGNIATGSGAGIYYGDLYGLARREGVTLRLDVLFSATEQVIQDMINDEATPNQFSIGVYQFNADVLPIVTGQPAQMPPARRSKLPLTFPRHSQPSKRSTTNKTRPRRLSRSFRITQRPIPKPTSRLRPKSPVRAPTQTSLCP